MTSGAGVRVYSYFDTTGYGLAGLSYVRGLVNAGVPVHWVPLVPNGRHWAPLGTTQAQPLMLEHARGDLALADLQALVAATSRPVDATTALVHTIPEQWPEYFQHGMRNVGYTTWEASAIPPHWKPLLDLADAVCVPSEFNRIAFASEPIRPRVHVVPHIRRHAWNEFEPTELQGLRAGLGIGAGDFVFYSISRWETRKNHELLLRGYLQAFQDGEPVALILKTSPHGNGAPPWYAPQPSTQIAESVIAETAKQLRSSPAKVCLLPYDMAGRGVDMLHALGDCYVSVSRGEGWAMGAFDAATRATPVLMPRWGGPLDYLGTDWPGAIDGHPVAAPVWPPHEPSY